MSSQAHQIEKIRISDYFSEIRNDKDKTYAYPIETLSL